MFIYVSLVTFPQKSACYEFCPGINLILLDYYLYHMQYLPWTNNNTCSFLYFLCICALKTEISNQVSNISDV